MKTNTLFVDFFVPFVKGVLKYDKYVSDLHLLLK